MSPGNMDEGRAPFLAEIEKNPLDADIRGIYADWLDEQGDPDEAERQRKIVGAHAWLIENVYRHQYYYYEYDEDDDGEGEGEFRPPSFENVVSDSERWASSLVEEEYAFFGDDSPTDELRASVELRREFLETLSVLANLPEVMLLDADKISFGCAC